jgi:hypothetical protein
LRDGQSSDDGGRRVCGGVRRWAGPVVVLDRVPGRASVRGNRNLLAIDKTVCVRTCRVNSFAATNSKVRRRYVERDRRGTSRRRSGRTVGDDVALFLLLRRAVAAEVPKWTC